MAGDPVDRSDELDQRIRESPTVQNLERRGQRNWLAIRLTIISLVLDLCLTALVLSAILRANAATEQAYQFCLSRNASRSDQVQLWEYVLSLSPSTTPAEQQERQAFQRYLNRVFTQTPCQKP